MPEIVTLVEWGVGLLTLVELPPVGVAVGDRDGALVPEGVPPPLGATAPPGDAAELRGEPTSITPIKQQAKVAVLVASEVDRLWTSALAMNYPFCAPSVLPGPDSAQPAPSSSPEWPADGPGDARR